MDAQRHRQATGNGSSAGQGQAVRQASLAGRSCAITLAQAQAPFSDVGGTRCSLVTDSVGVQRR